MGLSIRAYPAVPWEWSSVTPDFVLPVDALARESLRWVEKPGYNRVFVSGQDVGVLGQVTRAGTAGDILAPMVVNALITERGSRYGKFADGAEIMRDLKHVMHEVDGWNNLTPSQKEALDMIQHKIGRILNGDPTYDDNWKDIAGYATLVAEELNGVKK